MANPGDELGQLAELLNGMLDRLERSFAEMRGSRPTLPTSLRRRWPSSAARLRWRGAPGSSGQYERWKRPGGGGLG
ncbi:MAG: hypothetical protein U0797_15910 [Gemmataceae bacterium]